MDDTTVVVEMPTVNEPDMSTEAHELNTFNFTQYTHYIPEKVRDSVIHKLSVKSFGWKRRARLLKNMASHYDSIGKLEKQLVDLEVNDRVYSGHRIESNRDRLRNFFKNADETALRKYCEKLSVSFESFANDRVELIEALCDEMEAQG